MAGVAGDFGEGYRMGARIPLLRRDMVVAEPVFAAMPHQSRPLLPRETIDCSGANANLCEKPYGSSTLSLPIGLGVAIPLVVLAVVVAFLHRRNVKKQRREEANDPHKSLDFGLGENPRSGKGGKRKSAFFGGGPEKSSHRNNQLSMDMNLSSPYLLPPSAQVGSRESLHSLARSLHGNEDPYSPVYNGSDARSMRSKKGSRDDYHNRKSAALSVPPSRKSSFPTSPSSPVDSIPPRYESSHGDVIAPPPPASIKSPLHSEPQPILPASNAVLNSENKPNVPALATSEVPELQEPAPAKISAVGLPPSPRSSAQQPGNTNDFSHSGFDFSQDASSNGGQSRSPQQSPPRLSPPVLNSLPVSPRPVHHNQPTLTVDTGAAPAGPFSAPIRGDSRGFEFNDGVASPSQDQDEHDERGRPQHRRQSSEYPPENPTMTLGIPHQDNKRLSVGFRPLPPDEFMDTEDPETRANRIRSFYKEYFDESGGANGRMTMGYNAGGNGQQGPYNQQNGGAQYYEDYDQNYLGNDTAYYDPETNAFVMPYAQPVARRAMTPPPSGSRMPGPRGGPRPHAGSVGGMSMPGGRGPRRPGSAASGNRWGPGPRPGSSASGQYNRSRAGSAMGPRKPMPPPAALTTLPNPSKLRDDSFALMSAMDFAPPSTFKDQASGRSQSPGGGERRAYQAPTHVHSPLVSSFDEMASLPSPHLLRKSGTFTGLDFAPPRKFKDADTMSDAGSIRSNRSGISSVQLGAIRNGAGRVSRLPGDTVFSQAQMADTLKPQWGMRP